MRISNIDFEIILKKIIRNQNDFRIANFSFDSLEVCHITQLLAALHNNTTVHTLDLSVNFLKSESIELLASYLDSRHNIEKLELRGNHMGNDNVKLLLKALTNNCGIKILDLKDNCLSDAIIPNVKQLLKHNTTLQLINLTFNNFSISGVQELQKVASLHCLLQLNSKDKEYLRVVKATKSKIKLLFKLQIYIRYVLYENEKYIGEAKFAKKSNLWASIGDVQEGLININSNINEAVDFFLEHIQYSFKTGNFHDPRSFIETCLEHDDLTNMLLYEVVALPDSNSRNEILHIIGEVLFCSEKRSYKSMFNLVNAHICFLNITNKTPCQKRLLLESYRSLFSVRGLENSNIELEEWKESCNLNGMACRFENIIATIDAVINRQNTNIHSSPTFTPAKNDGLLMVLFANRCKTEAQYNIKRKKTALLL